MTTKLQLLEAQLAAQRKFEGQDRAHLAENPQSKSDAFFARASAAVVAELEQKIRAERQVRAREVVEIRLHEGPIGEGNAPLRLLARFLDELGESVERAAHRLFSGANSTPRVPPQVRQQLDLRVISLEAGSARIKISGQLQPDLGGAAALDTTLHRIFDVFHAEGDTFFDAIDAIGTSSARHLADALRPVQEHEVSVDFIWMPPVGNERRWDARPAQLANIRTKIEQIGDPELFEHEVSGQIVALNENGRLELRDSSGRRLRVRYGRSLMPLVASFHLLQETVLPLRTERAFERASQRWIEKHWLIDRSSMPAGDALTDRA